MIRKPLAVLLAALIAAPSFGAVVEAPSVSLAPALSAPTLAPATLSASGLLSANFLNSVSAPALIRAAPSLSAPAALPAPVPAAAAAAAPSFSPAAPDARGPPSARTSEGVAARVAAAAKAWAPIEKIFGSHDVLLMGESHGSLDSIETLTRAMPRLAAAGVKAIGIEGLKRPHQDAVDAYVSKRSDILPKGALNFSPQRVVEFGHLLTAARANGVRVVALGVPLGEWAEQASRLAAEKTGEPASIFPDDPGEQLQRAQLGYEAGYNEAVAEVYLTRRNRSMADFLAEAMKNGGKAVVLVGQAHVEGLDMIPGRLLNAPGAWGTLAAELTRRSLRAFSLTQTGGRFLNDAAEEDDRAARPQSYRRAGDAAPDGNPVFVPLSPDSGLWHAGFVNGPVAH